MGLEWRPIVPEQTLYWLSYTGSATSACNFILWTNASFQHQSLGQVWVLSIWDIHYISIVNWTPPVLRASWENQTRHECIRLPKFSNWPRTYCLSMFWYSLLCWLWTRYHNAAGKLFYLTTCNRQNLCKANQLFLCQWNGFLVKIHHNLENKESSNISHLQ